MKRAPGRLVLMLGLGASGCLFTSNVPDELGSATEVRPFVLRDSVDPPPLRILEGFPTEFLVPVAVDGPSSTCQWRVYVDRDRKNAAGMSGPLFEIGQTSGATPLGAGAVRRIRFTVDATATLGGGCALVEFFVARAFDDRSSPRTSPEDGEPDSVSWLVATGEGGCVGIVADAGPSDGGAPDGATMDGASDAR